ncbi:MAG: alkaline phosphatase family protein [Gemmatimonadota bacterium]
MEKSLEPSPEREPGPWAERDPGKVLLLFLDGVGIGVRDPEINPFFHSPLPILRDLLGDQLPSLDEPLVEGPQALAFPLDATLGVEGTPQSGTGQASFLTGGNGAVAFGRHFGPWVPVPLRQGVWQRNVLAEVGKLGGSVAFANALPKRYVERALTRRPAGPTLAAAGAGVLTRHETALARGGAVASELTNTLWRQLPEMDWIPRVTPEAAGRNLARLASAHDLTLFAHYRTDTEGHRGGLEGAKKVLTRLDRFLSGLLEELPSNILLLTVSDHGNLEDLRGGHTRNPALGLVKGLRPPCPLPTSLLQVPAYILAAVRLPGWDQRPSPPWERPESPPIFGNEPSPTASGPAPPGSA